MAQPSGGTWPIPQQFEWPSIPALDRLFRFPCTKVGGTLGGTGFAVPEMSTDESHGAVVLWVSSLTPHWV